MQNRTGTYVAFHAGGTTDPTASDIKYYNMLKAWHEHSDIEFTFTNSHEKTAAVRDSSTRETLYQRLRQRLNLSKNMLLILTSITKNDTDCVPYEVRYAIDECKIPIIAAYPGYNTIHNPAAARDLWPHDLASRIDNGSAKVIHIAFKQDPIDAAIRTYSPTVQPKSSLSIYTEDAYKKWGLLT